MGAQGFVSAATVTRVAGYARLGGNCEPPTD